MAGHANILHALATRPSTATTTGVRTTALLPLVLLFATGCFPEPALDLAADAYPAAPAPAEPVVRREISVVWAGADPSTLPPALPASPRDLVRPDPVPFRIGAGHGALGHVDLAPCREEGLQPGYLRMRVTFRRDGRIVHAAVESPAPPSPEALDCISDQLEEALVPSFDGKDATLTKSFFVEPGDPDWQPGDVIVRKGTPATKGTSKRAGAAGGPVTILDPR